MSQTHFRPSSFFAVILSVVFFSSVAPAEDSLGVSEGDRVRIQYVERGTKLFLSLIPYSGMKEKQMSGEVLVSSPDSISIRDWNTGDTSSLSLAVIKQLDISVGERRCTLDGFYLGAAAGALMSFGVIGGDEPVDYDSLSHRDTKWGTAAIIFAASALFGGAIGYHTKSDRWKKVPLESLTISAPVGPHTSCPSLTLSLRF